MKILLFGKNGQVGCELNRTLQPLGEVIAFGREDADFSNPESLRELVRDIKPDIIINAAAYTAVEQAEIEEELANTINSVAPGVLAEEAKRINALLMHYSTDYVFDGKKRGGYTEFDSPNPINAYGRSKLAGEVTIASVGCAHIIIRISWIYSIEGTNFLNTMLELSANNDVIQVVDDQMGAPTSAKLVAEYTSRIVSHLIDIRLDIGFIKKCNMLHMTPVGKVSWYDFAKEIFRLKGKTIKVQPIHSVDYPCKAARPLNSVLDCKKLSLLFNITRKGWNELLLDELNGDSDVETSKKLAKIVDLGPHGGGDGFLIALEGLTDNVPFGIKRVYYIYGVRDDLRRGFHAHKELKQLIACVAGKCSILLDNGVDRQTVLLDGPDKGLLIEQPLWREMFDFSSDCVLVVLASQNYDPDDYINSFKDYKNYLKDRSV